MTATYNGVEISQSSAVRIPIGSTVLEGDLTVPEEACGVVLFAHGSGSSRHSERNQYVGSVIRSAGVGTLLFDLLTREEEAVDIYERALRFDIELLSRRLLAATEWIKSASATNALKVGYFGSRTGGAAALVAAAELGNKISAVVSRGGRPDLAGESLARVKAPTLLLVGGLDMPLIAMNEGAYMELQCVKELRIISGATHLFEERGTLEAVASTAAAWFLRHLH